MYYLLLVYCLYWYTFITKPNKSVVAVLLLNVMLPPIFKKKKKEICLNRVKSTMAVHKSNDICKYGLQINIDFHLNLPYLRMASYQ